MAYNKDKHMQLELQNVTKSELKIWATKENRSVNNFINVAIEKYIKEVQREN